MVYIGRAPNIRYVENLDHRNLYSIKKMIGYLINELENAVENNDNIIIKQLLETAALLQLKIQVPHPFWAKKLNKVIEYTNKRVIK